MKADRTLDCVGLYCPMPIVKTAQEIKELAEGEILEVIADDKGIKSDMPAWCSKTGQRMPRYRGAGRRVPRLRKKEQLNGFGTGRGRYGREDPEEPARCLHR